MIATSLVELDKNFIIQAVADLLEQGLGTNGAVVVLAKNWHYVVGDVIHTDHWEEMGFLEVARLDELILNLPSVDEVQSGKVDLDTLKKNSCQWQLADKYKNFEIKWH